MGAADGVWCGVLLLLMRQGRMGNIQGYAGPLPAAYMHKQLVLAKKVVARMRQLGMTPVYPAFAGFVPAALKQLHPEASVTPSSNWCHFPDGYCCPLMLDPSDPLYSKIGAAYITTLRSHLGWDTASYYIADTFNEMKPASDNPTYLSGVAASVFEGMTVADPAANWVMQAWLFFSDSRFWQPPQIQVCKMLRWTTSAYVEYASACALVHVWVLRSCKTCGSCTELCGLGYSQCPGCIVNENLNLCR